MPGAKKSTRKSTRKAARRGGKAVGTIKFAKMTFSCRGKRVKKGKGKGKVARVFCARKKK